MTEQVNVDYEMAPDDLLGKTQTASARIEARRADAASVAFGAVGILLVSLGAFNHSNITMATGFAFAVFGFARYLGLLKRRPVSSSFTVPTFSKTTISIAFYVFIGAVALFSLLYGGVIAAAQLNADLHTVSTQFTNE